MYIGYSTKNDNQYDGKYVSRCVSFVNEWLCQFTQFANTEAFVNLYMDRNDCAVAYAILKLLEVSDRFIAV